MQKIRFSKRSKKFLETLFETIYENYPNSATEFLSKFKEYIYLLKDNKECKFKNIQDDCRVLIYQKNYIIIYKVYPNYIFIKTIKNSKQKGQQ